MRSLFIALSALLLSSCTFVVGSTEPDECRSHRECDALNGQFDPGYYAITACRRWQCSGTVIDETQIDTVGDPLDLPLTRGTCVFGPVDLDNDLVPAPVCADEFAQTDCDDLRGSRRPGASEICDGLDNDCDGTLDEGVFEPAVLASVPDIPNRSVGWSTSRALVAADTPLTGTLSPEQGIGVLESTTLVASTLVPADISARGGCLAGETCDLNEVSLVARPAAPALAAVVTTTGCREGALRLVAYRRDALEVVFSARDIDDRVSNVAPAIAADSIGACTDTDPAAGDPSGATRPSLALGPEGDTGLVAWLGASSSAGFGCDAAPAPLMTLGFLERELAGTGGPLVSLFEGTDDGVPREESPRATSAPSVLAVSGGWLVAWGEASALQLVFVASFSRDPFDERPLPPAENLATLPTGRVTGIALASAPSGEIALAWSEGCGEEPIHFTTLRVDPAGPSAAVAEAVTLDARGLAPTLAPAGGFTLEDGGSNWLLAYQAPEGSFILRLSDGEPLEAGQLAAAGAADPTLVTRDGGVDFYARTATSLLKLRASCADALPE